MAGKRIYEFTDEQATYSPDIYLATDDSSFASGAKKVKMSSIYPLTFTLDSAGTINTSTQLLRTDDGSGDESKITVDDLITAVSGDILNLIGLRMRLVATVTSAGAATKVYGDLTVSASKLSTGKYRVTHNHGSTNYIVLAYATGADNATGVRSIDTFQNEFDIIFADSDSLEDTNFKFTLIKIEDS